MSTAAMTQILYFVGGVFATVGVFLLDNRRRRRRPQLRSAVQFEQVFSSDQVPDVPELKLHYADTSVDSLVLSRIALWNGGQGAVDSSDNAHHDPLRISFPKGSNPLRYRTLYEGSTPVTVTPDPKLPSDLIFKFDFLDEGQGAVIEVLHESGEPTVKGALRGADNKSPLRELSLSTRALERIRSRSIGQRLWDRYGFLVPISAIFFLTISWASWDFYSSVGDPNTDKPVAASEYNLDSLDGQREFAEEVEARRTEGSLLGISVFAVVAVAILGGFTVLVARRHEVPSSILMNEANKDAV